MEKHRQISTYFWNDTYIENLDPIEKLLYLYLMTCPASNIAGAYKLSVKVMAVDTGIDRDMVLKIIGRFVKDKKVIYKDNYFAFKNAVRYQNLNNKLIRSGIIKIIGSLPKEIRDFIELDTLGTDEESLRVIDDSNKNKNKDIDINELKTLRTKDLIKYFIKKWEELYGKSITPNWGKWGKLSKTLLIGTEYDDVILLIDKYFKSTDKFVIENAHSFEIFYSMINKLKVDVQVRYPQNDKDEWFVANKDKIASLGVNPYLYDFMDLYRLWKRAKDEADFVNLVKTSLRG